MAVSINGESLIITLESAVTEIQWINVYSDWKDWLLSGHSNMGYPPAFSTEGGSPLTTTINSGSYWFLRNDLGWRIKPPEEDITIYAVGNLIPADSAYPILIPTTGAYTCGVFGLQDVTQGVVGLTDTQNTQLAALYKAIKNRKAIVKNGSVWELNIYDDDDVTPIFTKALKDVNGDAIDDLVAGILAEEAASSV